MVGLRVGGHLHAAHHVLDGVGGGLGLALVLHVLHLEHAAGGDGLAGGGQIGGLGGVELVADVLVAGRVDGALDLDGRVLLVDPGGAVHGVGVGLDLRAVLVVLDGVGGRLGLRFVNIPFGNIGLVTSNFRYWLAPTHKLIARLGAEFRGLRHRPTAHLLQYDVLGVRCAAGVTGLESDCVCSLVLQDNRRGAALLDNRACSASLI